MNHILDVDRLIVDLTNMGTGIVLVLVGILVVTWIASWWSTL